MSDILIRGMEMPTEGYIDVRIKCNGTASFAIADNPYFKAVEAIPVPEHGRLGDLDKLADNMRSATAGMEHRAIIMHEIRRAPTVIEAEEGE